VYTADNSINFLNSAIFVQTYFDGAKKAKHSILSSSFINAYQYDNTRFNIDIPKKAQSVKIVFSVDKLQAFNLSDILAEPADT
jgi:hypothetical protein